MGISRKIPTHRGCRSGERKCEPIIQKILLSETVSFKRICPQAKEFFSLLKIHNVIFGGRNGNALVTGRSTLPPQIQNNVYDDVNTDNLDQETRRLLPRFGLINARSLKNKIDEFAASVVCNNINVAAVTETWFQHDILDSFISVDGYEIHRKDRQLGRGGGVCIYLSQSLEGKRCLDLESPDFECMWVWLRPKRLLRPLSGLAVCVVYHPPGKSVEDQSRLRDYLISSTDVIKNKYPDSGKVILGDFNNL